MEFGRHILEWYLAVAIVILTVVSYMILAGVGFGTQSEFIMIALLLIILISVNILNSIIHLRMLDFQMRTHGDPDRDGPAEDDDDDETPPSDGDEPHDDR